MMAKYPSRFLPRELRVTERGEEIFLRPGEAPVLLCSMLVSLTMCLSMMWVVSLPAIVVELATERRLQILALREPTFSGESRRALRFCVTSAATGMDSISTGESMIRTGRVEFFRLVHPREAASRKR